jgi:hypothetical protein
MTRTGRFLLTLPLVVVVVAGCSTSKTPASVSGKVTLKGEPVPAGTITFHTEEGGIYTYTIATDGGYSGAQLPTGEMKVTIDTEALNPNRKKMDYGGPGGKDKKGATPGGYEEMMKKRGAVPETTTPTGKYVEIPKQ